jgi:hypothetical protein
MAEVDTVQILTDAELDRCPAEDPSNERLADGRNAGLREEGIFELSSMQFL